MKKTLLFASAMTLMLVSCNNDTENVNPVATEIILSANMETEVNSRTNFTPVGDFFWTKDDKIKVYTTTGSFGSFKVISGEGTASANFSGSISGSTSTCAVFPADAAGDVSGTTLTFNAPATYTYKYEQSDFATEMTPTINSTNIPMLAKINTVGSTSLNFKNLGGVFCFKFKDVPANTCKIVFTANSKICGPFTVDLTAAEPTITTSSTANANYKSIAISFAPSTVKTNRVVYIPVPCGTYEGYEVEMFDEDDNTTAYLESSKVKVIERSTALRFNEITITTLSGGIEGGDSTVDPYNGHEYVDLGLPSGLKWATCNIGADKPSDYGDYFAWGETETKTEFSWSTYIWTYIVPPAYQWDTEKLSRYSNEALQSLGVVDADGCLVSEYDAASAKWSGNWRMPTFDDFNELIDCCNWIMGEEDGCSGYQIIGPNNNSIFMPLAGRISQYGNSDRGYYWSSTSYDEYGSHYLTLDNNYVIFNQFYSFEGISIRPVAK